MSASARNGKPKGLAIVIAVALVFLALPVSGAGASSAGNGYVLMIHSTFEPHSHQMVDGTRSGNGQFDQAKTGTTYATGAAGATRDGDSIVFHAIPYLAAMVYPVVVRQPQLEVRQVGGGRRMMLQPNLPAGPERTWSP